VRESRSLGSVRGDRGNPVPYREPQFPKSIGVVIAGRRAATQAFSATITAPMISACMKHSAGQQIDTP
jgi:hypothetical protein